MAECECIAAGYCRRHGIIKDAHHLTICQTDPVRRLAWDTSAIQRGIVKSPIDAAEATKAQGRKSWSILHAMEDLSEEKILGWLATVPSYGCPCRSFALAYITENPPPVGVSRLKAFIWTWEFHDLADKKTGDARMSLEDAMEFWGVAPGVALEGA